MKKQVLVIAVVVVAIAMLATPVMACPTKRQKIPAEMSVLGFSAVPGESHRLWVSNCGIEIEKNLVITYDPILLAIDGETPLIGTSECSKYIRISNTNKGKSIICYNMAWEFSTVDGGFKGKLFSKLWDENTDSPMIKLTAVLWGYGTFEGQTLQLSRVGLLYVPSPWTGYILT